MTNGTQSWYEKAEPVFLIDYLQFGNTLRHATMEATVTHLRSVAIDSVAFEEPQRTLEIRPVVSG